MHKCGMASLSEPQQASVKEPQSLTTKDHAECMKI